MAGRRDAVAALVGANLGLAHAAAHKACKRWPHLDRDEVLSRCLGGLWEAARDFDPGLGFRFATYATWKFRGALSGARQAARPLGYRSRKPGKAMPLGPWVAGLAEVAPPARRHPDFDRVDARDAVGPLLALLPPDLRRVCELHHWGGLTFLQMEGRAWRSRTTLAAMHRSALGLMRAAIEGEHGTIEAGGRRGPPSDRKRGTSVRTLASRYGKNLLHKNATEGSIRVGPRVSRDTDPIPYPKPLRKPAGANEAARDRAFAAAVCAAVAVPERVHAIQILGAGARGPGELAAALGPGGPAAVAALLEAGLVRGGDGGVLALTPAGRMAWTATRALLS